MAFFSEPKFQILPPLLGLCFLIQGCSPGSFFGSGKESGFSKSSSYRSASSACSGLDFSGELNGARFSALLHCLNAEGELKELVELFDSFSAGERESWMRLLNQAVLSDPEFFSAWRKVLARWRESGELGVFLQAIASLEKYGESQGDPFKKTVLGALVESFRAGIASDAAGIASALKNLESSVEEKRVRDLLASLESILPSRAAVEFFESTRFSPALESVFLREARRPPQERALFLKALASGSVSRSLDEAWGGSEVELRARVPGFSQALLPWFQERGTALQALSSLLRRLESPLSCDARSGGVEARGLAPQWLSDWMRVSEDRAFDFLNQKTALEGLILSRLCAFPPDLSSLYSRTLAAAHPRGFLPLFRLMRSLDPSWIQVFPSAIARLESEEIVSIAQTFSTPQSIANAILLVQFISPERRMQWVKTFIEAEPLAHLLAKNWPLQKRDEKSGVLFPREDILAGVRRISRALEAGGPHLGLVAVRRILNSADPHQPWLRSFVEGNHPWSGLARWAGRLARQERLVPALETLFTLLRRSQRSENKPALAAALSQPHQRHDLAASDFDWKSALLALGPMNSNEGACRAVNWSVPFHEQQQAVQSCSRGSKWEPLFSWAAAHRLDEKFALTWGSGLLASEDRGFLLTELLHADWSQLSSALDGQNFKKTLEWLRLAFYRERASFQRLEASLGTLLQDPILGPTISVVQHSRMASLPGSPGFVARQSVAPQLLNQAAAALESVECLKGAEIPARVSDLEEEYFEGLTNDDDALGSVRRGGWEFSRFNSLFSKLTERLARLPGNRHAAVEFLRRFGGSGYDGAALGRWFLDRVNRTWVIPYFYPEEETPRVKIINGLDALELLLLNAAIPLPFHLPKNYALDFLGQIGSSWGDEPRESWPADVLSRYPRENPPTLRQTFERILGFKNTVQKWVGKVSIPSCETGPRRKMAVGRGRVGWLPAIKSGDFRRNLFNFEQLLPILEEDLLEAESGKGLGLKFLRDLFHDFSLEKEGLETIIDVVRLGVGRVIGRETASGAWDEKTLEDWFSSLAGAAKQPGAFEFMDLLFMRGPERDQALAVFLAHRGFEAAHSGQWENYRRAFVALPILFQEMGGERISLAPVIRIFRENQALLLEKGKPYWDFFVTRWSASLTRLTQTTHLSDSQRQLRSEVLAAWGVKIQGAIESGSFQRSLGDALRVFRVLSETPFPEALPFAPWLEVTGFFERSPGWRMELGRRLRDGSFHGILTAFLEDPAKTHQALETLSILIQNGELQELSRRAQRIFFIPER